MFKCFNALKYFFNFKRKKRQKRTMDAKSCCDRQVYGNSIENIVVENIVVENIVVENIENNFDINKYDPVYIDRGDGGMLFCITIKNKKYACKKVKQQKVNRFLIELDNIRNLSGQRLPVYYNFMQDKSYLYLLYNFIPGEDLYYSITKNEDKIIKNYKLIAEIIYEIALGLKELFLQNFVHLDIKPENIIISSLNPVKLTIIDLAFCQSLSDKNRRTNAGTYGWISPEIILYKTYYYNTDIWSLGLILYLLMSGNMLFCTNDKIDYLEYMANFTNIYSYENIDIKGMPANALDLLDNMLQNIHTYRYTINQVLNSSFLKQVNK